MLIDLRSFLRTWLRESPFVFALASGKLLLHVSFATRYGIFRDELYYIACGEHLDFGYVDHPPMIAWIARIIRELFGDSLFALRSTSAIAGVLTLLLTAHLCRRLGGNALAQTLASACVLVSPYFLATSHLFTMNAFEPLLWTLAVYMLVRIAQGEVAPSRWLAFGALVGVGLLNKHSTLFLGFGLFVAIVLTSMRRSLLTRWPWLALAIAIALFLPNLIWQYKAAFPTLEFMAHARAEKNVALSPLAFLREQVILMQPLTVVVWVSGTLFAFRRRVKTELQLIGITYGVLLVIMLVTRAKPYYLAPIYPTLFATGGVSLCAITERFRPLVMRTVLSLVLATGALSAPLSVPILAPQTLTKYTRGIHRQSGERHEQGPLDQIYADMFGWRELALAVAQVHHDLPQAEQTSAIVMATNYGEASALDYFGAAHGLPRTWSPHNAYWMWTRAEAHRQGTEQLGSRAFIVVGGKSTQLEQYFDKVELVGLSDHVYAMPYERHLPIYVCRGLKEPFDVFWAKVKRYV